MNKILVLLTTMLTIAACGVQRPMPLTISVINPTGLPFEQQGGMAVETSSMYNVKVAWDVTNTNAQGIIIDIADGADYDCSEPIATKTIYGILNSAASSADNSLYSSLGKMFESQIGLFQYGKQYAICLVSVQYNKQSSPSIPVFMTLKAY